MLNSFNDNSSKFEQYEKIIDILNGKDSIYKMIRLYIYKIILNKNEVNIDKYHLNKFNDYKEFIVALNQINKINYTIKTIKNEYFETSCQIINEYEKEKILKKKAETKIISASIPKPDEEDSKEISIKIDNFNNEPKSSGFNAVYNNNLEINNFNIKEYGIDNFYISTYNSTLSYLNMDNYLDVNKQLCIKINKKLFNEKKLLLKAIQLFYEPEKFEEIKKLYKIDSKNIKPLLLGYRYCLNEIFSENKEGIYFPLYESDNFNFIKNNYFPGNDNKYSIIYNDIYNHFQLKPEEGCYICLFNELYYHSVPSGFPGYFELNVKCPKCNGNIGSYYPNNNRREIKIVKNNNYFRIFKDQKEIEEIEKDDNLKNKLNEINYMTFDEFKNNYIKIYNQKDKGIAIVDKNSFKNDSKIIRNLSKISYRLLNFILYSHLFFARLITEKEDFDKYIPIEMNWVETLNECWILLKNELIKLDINSIEKFMQKIFADIFPILNEHKNISDYESLIKFEDKFEIRIKEIIEKFKKEEKKEEEKNNNSKNFYINFLNDQYTNKFQEKNSFYKYFYFTNFIDENYLIEKMKHIDTSKYPVLKNYIEYKKENKIKMNDNLINNFTIFNKALNLINFYYFNEISRKDAEKTKLKDAFVYINNKKLIDNFIEIYNNCEIINKNKEKLSNNNPLSDFFIDDSNNFGKSYKIIYEKFINQQNEKLERLLDSTGKEGNIDNFHKYKIGIQEINENDIFDLNLPKNNAFIDILFNSSYRKMIQNKLYNEYEINFDSIEKEMSHLLLKRKKILKDEIIYFSYINEKFTNEIKDSITSFKKNFIIKDINIDINDKLIAYEFYNDIKSNTYSHKQIIHDFMELIKFLNINKNNENNNGINEKTKILEIFKLKNDISYIFIKLFENKKEFTIDKIVAIFDCYLKLINKNVIEDVKNYQEKINNNLIEEIKKYFSKKHLINKKDFAYSIRLFISLVLFLEDDKENKIKNNYNNIINYLYVEDLWNNNIFNNAEFDKNLKELKCFNIPINQIISIYEILGKDFNDNYFTDVKEKLIFDKNNKENIIEGNDIDDRYVSSNYKY